MYGPFSNLFLSSPQTTSEKLWHTGKLQTYKLNHLEPESMSKVKSIKRASHCTVPTVWNESEMIFCFSDLWHHKCIGSGPVDNRGACWLETCLTVTEAGLAGIWLQRAIIFSWETVRPYSHVFTVTATIYPRASLNIYEVHSLLNTASILRTGKDLFLMECSIIFVKIAFQILGRL